MIKTFRYCSDLKFKLAEWEKIPRGVIVKVRHKGHFDLIFWCPCSLTCEQLFRVDSRVHTITIEGDKISIWPSCASNRQVSEYEFAPKDDWHSHFYITENEVHWCEPVKPNFRKK